MLHTVKREIILDREISFHPFCIICPQSVMRSRTENAVSLLMITNVLLNDTLGPGGEKGARIRESFVCPWVFFNFLFRIFVEFSERFSLARTDWQMTLEKEFYFPNFFSVRFSLLRGSVSGPKILENLPKLVFNSAVIRSLMQRIDFMFILPAAGSLKECIFA